MNIFPSGSINFGFSAGDLVSNAGALVQQVGPYVLLGLAFVVAPLFIGLIRGTIRGRLRA